MEKTSTTTLNAGNSKIPSPPANIVHPKDPYNPEEDALTDLPALRYALDLFLSSHMVESENFCSEMDPPK